MGSESSEQPPFVDNGDGYPTPESVQVALDMFNLGSLSEVRVQFMDSEGPMTELIARCRINRLVENWPKAFIAQVVGAASEAGQQGS